MFFFETDSNTKPLGMENSSCHVYNPNDYCFNPNPQNTSQFVSYPNYHHDQFLHHHYPQYAANEENHSYVPYDSSYSANLERQENVSAFPASNDLYEFLPEEIFQLDQPIVKSEAPLQNFNSPNSTTPALYDAPSMSQIQPTISYSATTQNYDHLNGSDMQSSSINNYSKYNSSSTANYLEINNNSNYNGTAGSQEENYLQRVPAPTKDIDPYNYQSSAGESPASRYTENEKKRSFFQTNHVVSSADGTSKRDSSLYFFQQSPAYYIPDIHPIPSNKSVSSDFINRSMEKYNFIVNH